MPFAFSERHIAEYYRDGYTVFCGILPPAPSPARPSANLKSISAALTNPKKIRNMTIRFLPDSCSEATTSAKINTVRRSAP